MRAVLSMVLVGLVVCVGCEREPDAEVSKSTEASEPTPDEVVDAIKKLGEGGVAEVTVNESGSVVGVFVVNSILPEAGLVHLKGLTKLESLSLTSQKLTDAGLVHLKGLTTLQKLSLGGSFTDAGIAHLQGLTNLTMLSLLSLKVTPAGVKKLQQALPNCDISH